MYNPIYNPKVGQELDLPSEMFEPISICSFHLSKVSGLWLYYIMFRENLDCRKHKLRASDAFSGGQC